MLCFIRRKGSSHPAGETENSHRAKWTPGHWLLWSRYKLVKRLERLRSLSLFLFLSLHTHSHPLQFILSFRLPLTFCFPSVFSHHLSVSHMRSQLDTTDKLFWLGNTKLSPRFTCWDLLLLMLLFGNLATAARAWDWLRLCGPVSI